MTGFAVVGLGMGKNRAEVIRDTDGADLKLLVDLDAERAESVATELETEWTTELDAALDRDDVDVVEVAASKAGDSASGPVDP